MNLLKKLLKHRHKFRVIRTIWPYVPGYGTYCRGCGMLLDTGLPLQQAIDTCHELNRR